jgi:hypothetical protein
MNSNIRPKCEPIIQVLGKNENGENVVLEWRSKDLESFSYKASVDPLGRKLPTIELNWTEIYTDRLNQNNITEKYNLVQPYMEVRLIFRQQLSYFTSWRDIFNKKTTWQELNRETSWRDIFIKKNTEDVYFFDMFLVGKPEVKGQKIHWKAKDLLSFLNNPQSKGFQAGTQYTRPNSLFLLDERSNFRNSRTAIDYITRSVYDFENFSNTGTFENIVIFEGTTKDLIKNNEATRNRFIVFSHGNFSSKSVSSALNQYVIFEMSPKILKTQPTLKKNTNVSGYDFSYTVNILDEDNKREVAPNSTSVELGTTVNRFVFDKIGLVGSVGTSSFVAPEITKSTDSDSAVVQFTPVNSTIVNDYIQASGNGENFIERNTCNVFNKNSSFVQERVNILNSYFSENIYTMEFDCMPLFHLEPADVVIVPTNLYVNDEKVKKKAILLSQEISYNGAFSSKMIFHEVGD